MSPEPDDKQPCFEKAIEDLEQIIDRIESGQIGLEECLAHYERGMKLVQRCQSILTTAQTKMARIKVDFDGNLREEGAAAEDDDKDQPEDHDADDDSAESDADIDAQVDDDDSLLPDDGR